MSSDHAEGCCGSPGLFSGENEMVSRYGSQTPRQQSLNPRDGTANADTCARRAHYCDVLVERGLGLAVRRPCSLWRCKRCCDGRNSFGRCSPAATEIDFGLRHAFHPARLSYWMVPHPTGLLPNGITPHGVRPRGKHGGDHRSHPYARLSDPATRAHASSMGEARVREPVRQRGRRADERGRLPRTRLPGVENDLVRGAKFANALSQKDGKQSCYELRGCKDISIGGLPYTSFVCDEVVPTGESVYSCNGYRYPTDAEWEYSARAGTKTPYYSGDVTVHSNTSDCILDPNLDKIGWYCWNSPQRLTHPVQQKAPNGWGLFDMLGNADELVGDPFFGRYQRSTVDPWQSFSTAQDNHSPVKRGGVIYDPHALCRSAWRSEGADYEKDYTVGLRLARTLAPDENWTPPKLPEPPDPPPIDSGADGPVDGSNE